MILWKDILNLLLEVHGTDNLDECQPQAFIDAIVPALVYSGKRRLVNRSSHIKPVEEYLVFAKA